MYATRKIIKRILRSFDSNAILFILPIVVKVIIEISHNNILNTIMGHKK